MDNIPPQGIDIEPWSTIPGLIKQSDKDLYDSFSDYEKREFDYVRQKLKDYLDVYFKELGITRVPENPPDGMANTINNKINQLKIEFNEASYDREK